MESKENRGTSILSDQVWAPGGQHPKLHELSSNDFRDASISTPPDSNRDDKAVPSNSPYTLEQRERMATALYGRLLQWY